ncbi:MAG: hypothetical protein E7231_18465 [Cellulosilyticum sp.]|nr:hypothetical protein [Cellulosilyticum sp.]
MKKRTILTTGLLLLMLLLLCFPNLCLQAAQSGLLLWFNKVLPSLLPFIIFINILVPLNGLQGFISWCTPLSRCIWHLPGESFFAFIIGLIAGYPMGAKIIKSFYIEHKLTKEEAERSLCFCNNCGPLFIIGTIGTAMLSKTSIGYFLLFIHILSACIMSFLITRGLSNTFSTTSKQSLSNTTPSLFSLFNLAISNSMDTIVCVGGYIIFFSVILSLFTQTPLASHFLTFLFPKDTDYIIIKGIFSSCLELSNGAYTLSTLPISAYSLALLSAAIGFGGICVYFQSLFVLEDSPFDTKPFFLSKCIQGFLSFALTLLFYPFYIKLFQPDLAHSLYTLNTNFTLDPLSTSLFIIALCILFSQLLFHSPPPNITFDKILSCFINKKKL